MILQKLNEYYERLEKDESVLVPRFGKSLQQIAFAVVIDRDGNFSHPEDLRQQDGKKSFNRSLIVLGQSKPSGSGINPCFLWDNPAYLLGYKPADPKPARTRECFEAFRDKHIALEQSIDDEGYSAVCRFLETWNPDHAGQFALLEELSTGFAVFQLKGDHGFVHERPRVEDYWNALGNESEESEDVCLITASKGPVALTHDPAIKGVAGAQSSGAKIVSFNCDAFTSYGKDQSQNAPVSEKAAFQYATALNYLLRRDSCQKIRIGDTTTVFWTETPSPIEDVFSLLLDPSSLPETDSEDEGKLLQLRDLLGQLSKGILPQELGEASTKFYILGLAPNAARLSVRFWEVNTVENIVRNVGKHYERMNIQRGPKDAPFPAVWQLLRETARESKDVSPLLGGTLLRAILNDAPYPQSLPLAVMNRIRVDRRLNATRISILKAFLIKNHNQILSMSLDLDNPKPGYRLGRLFAVLEKTQEDALPGINATIRDRFYSSASSTPEAVFSRLLRTYQHHLAKLEGGRKVNRERLVQEIMSALESLPKQLNLEGQGLFAIGYYHQRQDFFKNRKKTEETEASLESSI